jgi:hypothetical protein
VEEPASKERKKPELKLGQVLKILELKKKKTLKPFEFPSGFFLSLLQ